MNEPLLQSDIPGLKLASRGKVRDHLAEKSVRVTSELSAQLRGRSTLALKATAL